jgi:DNA-binding CsgD family transcriptional regulator
VATVGLVVPDGSLPSQGESESLITEKLLLVTALAAALMELGWICGPTEESVSIFTVEPSNAAESELSHQRVVLVVDDQGLLPRVGPLYLPSEVRLVVVVGALPAIKSLVVVARWTGATVAVNADQPFIELILAVHNALAHPPARNAAIRSKLECQLRQRDQERRRFDVMTMREKEVLSELIAGKSAEEIAAVLHVSISTVRTHIRGVLTKLGVSTQIAAIALAHRSCRDSTILKQIRRIYQY